MSDDTTKGRLERPGFIGAVPADGFVIDDTNYFRFQVERELRVFWRKARRWFAGGRSMSANDATKSRGGRRSGQAPKGASSSGEPLLRVFTLIKLFDKLEHAEAMLRGRLHMKSLRFFREYRDSKGELRGDPYEGVGSIFQPSRLSEIRFGEVVIPPKDLAGPLLIHPSHYSDWNVFCTFAVTNDGLLDKPISPSTLDDLKKAMQIHEQCFGLGTHAVLITNCEAFLERAAAAFRRLDRTWKRSLVQYYDDTSFHGTFDEDDVPFRKRQRYRVQREYRFAVQAEPGSGEPLEVELGDLSDIAQVTTPDWINANLTLELPQPQAGGANADA